MQLQCFSEPFHPLCMIANWRYILLLSLIIISIFITAIFSSFFYGFLCWNAWFEMTSLSSRNKNKRKRNSSAVLSDVVLHIPARWWISFWAACRLCSRLYWCYCWCWGCIHSWQNSESLNGYGVVYILIFKCHILVKKTSSIDGRLKESHCFFFQWHFIHMISNFGAQKQKRVQFKLNC